MRELDEAVTVKVMGARGSMPAEGEAVRLFGGATSCYRIQARGCALYLDAGTGLIGETIAQGAPVRVLLTHAHLDHILGLPLCPAMLLSGGEVHLYGETRNGLTMEAQVSRMLTSPLWPLGLHDFPARVICHEMMPELDIAPFVVESMASCHPGGSTVYRVSVNGRRIVYATDFEHLTPALENLVAFSKNADLLLYDAAYTGAEYPHRLGFGHSTAEMGLYVQRESGAKNLLLIHYDYSRTDAALLEIERSLGVRFARQGEVIAL